MQKPPKIIATAALLISLVFPCAGFGQSIELPDIGSSAEVSLSVEEERALGEAFMRSVRQRYNLLEDPVVSGYVQDLGHRLGAHVEGYPFDFTFFVVDDPQINAFAGPAGYIGVNAGLVQATESEDELASVVAHEIAHLTQRHYNRSFETANKLTLSTAAAVIAAILIGNQNPEASEAILAAGVAGSAQSQINFTRANEAEADRVGMQLLIEGGFNPRAMPSFFEKLQQRTRIYSSGFPEFLRTHPVTLSRISDSRNRAEQYPYKPRSEATNYYLAQQKLQLLAHDDPKVLVRQQREIIDKGKYRDLHAARYGYALALIASGEYEKADEVLETLIQKDRERVPYLLAKAQVRIEAGRMEDAAAVLKDALALYPYHKPLTLAYARALLTLGRTQTSKTLLEEHIRTRSADPAVYKLLAQAEKADGDVVASHQALAEYFYLNGYLHQAISHLQVALRNAEQDSHARSRIEARLNQLESEAIEAQQAQEGDDRG